jgi:hypothetical protein
VGGAQIRRSPHPAHRCRFLRDAPPSPPLRGGRGKTTPCLAFSMPVCEPTPARPWPMAGLSKSASAGSSGGASGRAALARVGLAGSFFECFAGSRCFGAFGRSGRFAMTPIWAESVAGKVRPRHCVSDEAQNPLALYCFKIFSRVTCSTSGGEAKQWPTSLRHSWKSGRAAEIDVVILDRLPGDEQAVADSAFRWSGAAPCRDSPWRAENRQRHFSRRFRIPTPCRA